MKPIDYTYEGKPQELFDDVVNHLRQQGCKSQYESSSCKYRTKSGLRCAIGGIIPDELYFEGIEGTGASSFHNERCWSECNIVHAQKIGNRIGKSNSQLASRLQSIHDRDNIKKWESEFEKTAEFHNLVYTPPVVPAV